MALEDANGDGEITEADPAFSEIALWFDTNHDGVSQRPELIGVATAGVRSIAVHYSSFEQKDPNGNRFAFRSSMIIQRERRARTLDVYDVFLRTAPLAP